MRIALNKIPSTSPHSHDLRVDVKYPNAAPKSSKTRKSSVIMRKLGVDHHIGSFAKIRSSTTQCVQRGEMKKDATTVLTSVAKKMMMICTMDTVA